jgi:hypothetical protein
MSDVRSIDPDVVVIWGSHPGFLYERSWLLHLLRPWHVHEVEWHQHFEPFVLHPGGKILLVESARELLEAEIRQVDLDRHRRLREERLRRLQDVEHLLIWHVSDEQGLDGDGWYSRFPRGRTVLREFPHARFDREPSVQAIPLGPTRAALINVPWHAASNRRYPWCFMGTIWPGTSRQLAVNCFEAMLPDGFVHAGQCFGQGVAVNQYVGILHQAIFSLCPEGHRHFETFRFYESLEMGAIPLCLHTSNQFASLFRHPWPLPLFTAWEQAADFARGLLGNADQLNRLQWQLRCWWEQERALVAEQLKRGFAQSEGHTGLES